jgi:23S rRNA (adenine2503-C2)-methyltransferase
VPFCEVEKLYESTDGTRKFLLKFGDESSVESVLIPEIVKAATDLEDAPFEPEYSCATDLEDDEPVSTLVRVTQCISTQVGCAMGCAFCASGVSGLKRHMTPEEIVAQVLVGKTLLKPGEELRNVVLMGMGEPLANYDATARALRLLTRAEGINLSTRRVTVSTSGIIPGIERLGEDFGGMVTLAISLHATTNEQRTKIMPINQKYPLEALLEALRRYPLPKRKRFTIEYTLLADQNDSLADAKRLVQLLRKIPVKIDLIPMNPIAPSSLAPPDNLTVLSFQRVLLDAGYTCFIRRRRGDDVAAACGQLALLGGKPRPRRPFAVET